MDGDFLRSLKVYQPTSHIYTPSKSCSLASGRAELHSRYEVNASGTPGCVSGLPHLNKLNAKLQLVENVQEVTVAITTKGTRDKEEDLVEVSALRKEKQKKGTTPQKVSKV